MDWSPNNAAFKGMPMKRLFVLTMPLMKLPRRP